MSATNTYFRIADYTARLLGLMMVGLGVQAQFQPEQGKSHAITAHHVHPKHRLAQ